MKSLLKEISLIFIILLSFATNVNSQKADKSNVGGLLYFPMQLSDVKEDFNDKMRDFRNRWYSKHLASMNEPVLYDKKDRDLKVFRYTNLGTNSNPFVIRVELIDSIVLFNYKLTDGQGGYGTGKLIKEIQIQLPVSDWNKIIAKVESTRFWDLSSYRSFDSDGNRMVILDGTEWILEGLIGDKYHFVTRNTPESEGDKDYASLCNLMYEYFLVIDKEATRKNDPHLVNFKLKI
jgi:hypothetical protein